MLFIVLISSVFFTANITSANASADIELSTGSVVEVSFFDKKNGYRYEVNFENGHGYFYERSGNNGFGGGSSELTDKEMSLAEEAIDKYEQAYGSPVSSDTSSSDGWIGILFVLAGLLGAVFPYAAWYIEIGWKIENAEPSDFAMFANRAGGIIGVIIGLFILFFNQ